MEEESAADPGVDQDKDEEDEHDDELDELDKYFESDDEDIKQSLKTLLNMPLEFMDDSSDEEEESSSQQKDNQAVREQNKKEIEGRSRTTKEEEELEEDSASEQQKREIVERSKKENATKMSRGDSVERQLEKLFVDEAPSKGKDTGFESISDNEFDGPESGECDTSDGELPDSPNIVVTLPETPPIQTTGSPGMDDVSGSESDVELLGEFEAGNEEKPRPQPREVIVERKSDPAFTSLKAKEKKEVKPSPPKDKSKVKDKKKDKRKKSSESDTVDEEHDKIHKLKKYLAKKCYSYIMKMAKNEPSKKKQKSHTGSEISKISPDKNEKLKSIVGKAITDRCAVNHSQIISKSDQKSHMSQVSRSEKALFSEIVANKKISSPEKEHRKSKSSKKSKSRSKEIKEHKLRYKQYMQYLQLEREKCYEESLVLEKHKTKSKRKRRKSESSNPDKTQTYEKKESVPKFLSFAEFCESRELLSPERELSKKLSEPRLSVASANSDGRKERTVSTDSLATTSTEPVDEEKELFITYSDLVEQDKQKVSKLSEDRDQIETILEKDPELKSISVFTSVLFKGSTDSSGIPFLQEEPPPSPKKEPEKSKKTFILDKPSGPDEIYDWNDDDLSLISQSSLSPSRSPAPKVHNKALLNFVENQKERSANEKSKLGSVKPSKSSRSRSKSPKKERSRSKKRKLKHRSSKSISSVSPSPPPLKPRSPDMYKKRVSPPSYLKDRWRDYPSSPERRKEHYDRPSRSRRRSRSRTRVRVGHGHRHRSHSSSEERHQPPLKRYHRSRSRSRSNSPPPAMVQVSAAEKRRLLKEEHERALASLRATIRGKPPPTTPVSFTSNGDSYEPIIMNDNYEPVVMNEVPREGWKTEFPPLPPIGRPPHYPGMIRPYYPPHSYNYYPYQYYGPR